MGSAQTAVLLHKTLICSDELLLEAEYCGTKLKK